jgi:hypothetical protein
MMLTFYMQREDKEKAKRDVSRAARRAKEKNG